MVPAIAADADETATGISTPGAEHGRPSTLNGAF